MSRLQGTTAAATVALALAGAGLRAEDAASLDERVAGAVERVLEAAERIAAGDRAGAAARAAEAADLAAALRAALDAEDSRAALARSFGRVRKDARSLESKLRKASRKADDPLTSDDRAEKAAEKAVVVGAGILRTLRRVPGPGVPFWETDARSAGIHAADADVDFTLLPGLVPGGSPCPETPQVRVVVSGADGSFDTTVQPLPADRRGNQRFRVAAGAVAGAARVEVTACGVTRRWLLFNRGPAGTFSTKAAPAPGRFDGTWAGGFKGTVTLPNGTRFPASPGTVGFQVANGTIMVTDPGTGTGTVSPFGKTLFSGSGAAQGARYTFQGTFTSTFSGAAASSGNWTARFQGGTAHGTWNATRQ